MSKNHVKISDFGLALKMYNYTGYVKRKEQEVSLLLRLHQWICMHAVQFVHVYTVFTIVTCECDVVSGFHCSKVDIRTLIIFNS